MEEVRSLCMEFKDCFAKAFSDLEPTPLTDFHIELKPEARPVCCRRPRRFAPKELKFMKEQLSALENSGLLSKGVTNNGCKVSLWPQRRMVT